MTRLLGLGVGFGGRLLAAGAGVVLAFGVMAVSAAGVTAPPWPEASELTLPANAATASGTQFAEIHGVSCTGAGVCGAGGSYTDMHGVTRAMVAGETDGAWGQASELTPPANAATTSSGAVVEGVSCASAGACGAGGTYTDTGGVERAMVASETGGVWGQANELTLPSNAATSFRVAEITGVSCTSEGNCAAGGAYTDTSGALEPMVASQTDGIWGQASELTPPANASTTSGTQAAIYGVSCTSAGNCAAGGIYNDMSGAQQAMVASETNGSWGQASELTLPANALSTPTFGGQAARIQGVSCARSGTCVAAGTYEDTSGVVQAMVANETDGTWGQASQLMLPANAATGQFGGGLEAVSCTSVGNCVAGGGYTDTSGAFQAMVASETDGIWGQASELPPPANALTTTTTALGSQSALVQGISCTSVGGCVAGGHYRDTGGAYQAMVASSVGPLSVSTTRLPAGIARASYDAQLSATGGAGSYTWSLASGALPHGLSLSSNGTISGTPTKAGASSFEVQVSDPGPPAETATATLSIRVSPTVNRSARVGNQRITLTIPSMCVTPSTGLPIRFASTRLAKGTNLRFVSVAFYVDKGVTHKIRERIHGKRKLVTVHLSNATRRHQPASLNLSVAKLRTGKHTLKVIVTYTKTERRHGHKAIVTVTKVLRVNFRAC